MSDKSQPAHPARFYPKDDAPPAWLRFEAAFQRPPTFTVDGYGRSWVTPTNYLNQEGNVRLGRGLAEDFGMIEIQVRDPALQGNWYRVFAIGIEDLIEAISTLSSPLNTRV